MVLVMFVRMWKREKWRREEQRLHKTDTITVICHLIGSHLLALHLKWLFSIIHHLDWVSHSLCPVLSLANPSESCIKGGLSLSGSRGESHWDAQSKSWDLKRLSSRNRCTSPWECTHFHVRTSLKAGVHYQHNGPADGCPCHTRLSVLEDHSRQPCSEGCQGRVTGHGRAAGVVSQLPSHFYYIIR